MRIAHLTVAIVLASVPALAAGQSQSPERRCEIQSVSSSSRGTTLRDEGRTFMGGGVFFECPGGTTIRSDSLAHFKSAGMIEFLGNVHYADTVKTLSAGYVRYIGRIGQIIAQDSVVLSDIASGSQIWAPYLEYFQATETRPEALVRIPSGRPRAILVSRRGDSPLPGEVDSPTPDRPDPDSASADTLDSPDSLVSGIADVEPPDSTFIDADAMDFYGERLAIARGNVVVLREAMQAFGREAHFDQRADSMLLTGDARVVTDERQVHGDTIAALLTPEQDIRQVNAWRNARLESEDLDAEAPGLRILFENGEVNRMIALGERTGARGWRPEPAEIDEAAQPEETAESAQPGDTTQPGEIAQSEQTAGRLPAMERPEIPDPQLTGVPVPPSSGPPEESHGVQARVTSKEMRMVGDSIDAVAPDQQLERVVAVGAAFGERITTDTTIVRPAIAANDWMSGDTIIATFAEAPDSVASDTAAADVIAAETETSTTNAADTTGAGVADTATFASAEADTASARAERVLETLTAIGTSTDARSLYAAADEEDPTAPPALSYLIAQRIHVTLRDGAVFDVNAVGRDGQPVHGLYLEPADSARADTVARTEREP